MRRQVWQSGRNAVFAILSEKEKNAAAAAKRDKYRKILRDMYDVKKEKL